MEGPIYFGGLSVSGHCEEDMFATSKEELEKKLTEDWKQEVRNVLKFIDDSKLDMPLMRRILASSSATVTIQEYQKIA